MISSYKTLSLALLAILSMALLAGCNDTLRQFIVPIPKPGGDSAAQEQAVVLSTNPSGNGSTMHINVSGDSIMGVVPTGINPVFLGKAGASVFVINGDGTVGTYLALTPPNQTVLIATLPGPPLTNQAISPVAGGTANTGSFYTANRGSDNASVVSGGAVTSTITFPAGSQPVAVAGNGINSKLYVVNQAGNVAVVSTINNSVIKTIPVGAQPIWAVMSADGSDVFVVNQGSGTVSVIDTTVDSVIATITVGSTSAPSPNFAFYEPSRQRLYVSNTGENTVSIIKADGINLLTTPPVVPTLLKNVPVSGTPVSVAALNDGTKAYAALGNCPAGTNHTNLLANLGSCNGNLLSVIDATALRESGTMTVGSGAVSVDVANDSSRVYAVAAHDGTVADIRVATGTVFTFPAPQQNLSCTNPSACPANVTQTPFMVRVFP